MDFKLNIGTLTTTIKEYNNLAKILNEQKQNINNAISNLYDLGWSGEARDQFEVYHNALERKYAELEEDIKYLQGILENEEKPKAVLLKKRCEGFAECVARGGVATEGTSDDEGIISLDFIGSNQMREIIDRCTSESYNKMNNDFQDVSDIIGGLEYTSFNIGDNVNECEDSVGNQKIRLKNFEESLVLYCQGVKEMESNICSKLEKISGQANETCDTAKDWNVSVNSQIDKASFGDILGKVLLDIENSMFKCVEKIAGENKDLQFLNSIDYGSIISQFISSIWAPITVDDKQVKSDDDNVPSKEEVPAPFGYGRGSDWTTQCYAAKDWLEQSCLGVLDLFCIGAKNKDKQLMNPDDVAKDEDMMKNLDEYKAKIHEENKSKAPDKQGFEDMETKLDIGALVDVASKGIDSLITKSEGILESGKTTEIASTVEDGKEASQIGKDIKDVDVSLEETDSSVEQQSGETVNENLNSEGENENFDNAKEVDTVDSEKTNNEVLKDVDANSEEITSNVEEKQVNNETDPKINSEETENLKDDAGKTTENIEQVEDKGTGNEDLNDVEAVPSGTAVSVPDVGGDAKAGVKSEDVSGGNGTKTSYMKASEITEAERIKQFNLNNCREQMVDELKKIRTELLNDEDAVDIRKICSTADVRDLGLKGEGGSGIWSYNPTIKDYTGVDPRKFCITAEDYTKYYRHLLSDSYLNELPDSFWIGKNETSIREDMAKLREAIERTKNEAAKLKPSNQFGEPSFEYGWNVDNCAEIWSSRDAILKGARYDDLVYRTENLRGGFAEPCENCERTFKGTYNIDY